ncbi:MAG: hypothetical protein JXM68_01210 [Sedimentisphaerales bacterium]|nr:hypothetical protein [Sedimentisphaerales bacterium]
MLKEKRIYRLLPVVKLLALALTGSIIGPASAAELRCKVNFTESDFNVSSEYGYDIITYTGKGGDYTDIPGEPLLPVRYAHIQIPANARVTNVTTSVLTERQLTGTFDIMPTQVPVPVSKENKTSFTEQAPNVYLSPARYRKQLALSGTSGNMQGTKLLPVTLMPLDYIPLTGEMFLAASIEITIEYELEQPQQKWQYKHRNNKKPLLELHKDSIINYTVATDNIQATVGDETQLEPEASLATIPHYFAGPVSQVEYLVITTEEFLDEFAPLVNWKNQKGLPAAAVLVSDICARYGTSDNSTPEKIKLCIADYARNKGTLWVVLGADHNNIPAMKCYGSVNTSPSPTIASDIPTELYYSDIDDIEWDDNGDGLFGKLQADGDTIDMYPDVYVGRISAYPGYPEHVSNAVAKIVNYEKNCPTENFAENFLIAGATLWGNIGEVVDSEAKSELLWTKYIAPYWSGAKYRFYSTNTDFASGADYTLNAANLAQQVNNGYNFLHMACHGSSTSWLLESGSLTSSNIFSLMADQANYLRPDATNIVTMACLTNAFDLTQSSLSEAFLRTRDGGAVSYIGGTRYGWGWPNSSSAGVSLQYNQTFYQYLFDDNNSNHIGETLALAKASKISGCTSYNSNRWVQFSLALMGDPEMTLYTTNPAEFTVTAITEIGLGQQNYSISTNKAEALVCLSKGNEIYYRGLTNRQGKLTATITPTTPGEMTLTITAKNFRPYTASIFVTTPALEPCKELTVANLAGQISLIWQPSLDENFDHYQIFSSDSLNGPFALAGTTQYEYFLDETDYNNCRYYFVVPVDIYGLPGETSDICGTCYQALPVRTTDNTTEGIIALEAEDWDFNARHELAQWNTELSTPGYSGTAAMSTGQYDLPFTSTDGPALQYRVYFDQPGQYFVSARAWASNNDTPGCFIGINDTPCTQAISGHTPGQWSWSTNSQSVTFNISTPGIYTISVWAAQPQYILDKILISLAPVDQPDYVTQCSYAGTTDLFPDGKIDLNDFAIIANQWLTPYTTQHLTDFLNDWGLCVNP